MEEEDVVYGKAFIGDNNIEEAGGSDSGNEFEKIGITLEK
ncbi:3804_t:CDS:2 [Entrophospora sp. SA101]|nr:3804_t:CDS:2 [Entrophospora sp. SA101]